MNLLLTAASHACRPPCLRRSLPDAHPISRAGATSWRSALAPEQRDSHSTSLACAPATRITEELWSDSGRASTPAGTRDSGPSNKLCRSASSQLTTQGLSALRAALDARDLGDAIRPVARAGSRLHAQPGRARRSRSRAARGSAYEVKPTSKRRIGVVTTSRADYSHLYWPLRELAAHPGVELGVFTLGAHLSPEFGSTINEIERDGFPIQARIECLLSSDTDTGMAKTIGIAILGLADALTAWRPDLLLLIADRYEMLAPASVALALRIPIAHIEGGEIIAGRHRRPGAQRAHQDGAHSLHLDADRAPPRDCHGRGAVARASCRRALARSPAPLHAA